MRALITRPAEDAERIAAPLRARGVEVVLEPLLVILPAAGPAPTLDGVQALLFTSANGVRAFAAASSNRVLPAFAVGDATAKVAREAGFATIHSANGDVVALATLARERLSPKGGALVHVTGTATAGDLAGELEAQGFQVRLECLYQARTAVALSRETRDLLAQGGIDAVFLFSPRTTKTFADLLTKAQLTQALSKTTLYALSPAVAEALADLPARATRVAGTPTQDALLALFDQDWSDGKEDGTDHQAIPSIAPVDPAAGTATGSGDSDETKKGGFQGMSTPGKDDRPDDKAGEAVEETTAAEAKSKDAEAKAPGSEVVPTTAEADADESDAAYGGSTAEAPVAASAGPPRKTGSGLLLSVLALLVLAGAAGSYPWWRPLVPEALRAHLPPIPGAPDSPKVTALEGRVVTLDGRVAVVEKAIADLKAEAGAMAEDPAHGAVTGRLAALERDIAALKGAPSPLVPMAAPGTAAPPSDGPSGETPVVALPDLAESDIILALREDLNNTKETLVDLRDQLAEMETAQADLKADQVAPSTVLALAGRLTEVEGVARQANTRRNSALALLLAVGQLREAAGQGEPFEAELKAVDVIAKGSGMQTAGIAPLAPLAATGVSTRADLRARFDGVSRAVAQAVVAPEGADWMDRTLSALTNLVTVRRVDDRGVEDAGPLDTLSRAEAMVIRNDLTGAVLALEGLEGAAAEVAAPWVAAAKAKLAAESALSELTSDALAAVGAADALDPAAPVATGGTEG
jgi:uroporphyrinogen-III synthase